MEVENIDPIDSELFHYSIASTSVTTVKEMSADEQPRERAIKYGVGTLSVPELWAILLRTGSVGYPITQLCKDMMKNCDDKLHNLERWSLPELCDIPGIGETKAIQVLAVMELIKRYCREEIPVKDSIRSSVQIYELMKLNIGNLDHEEIWMLLLNRQNIVTKMIRHTSGTSTSSVFDVKKAVRSAILGKADGVILCHNHPSGTLKPSPQDDSLTRNFKEACKYMEIRLLDHVIVTANGFYSYNDSSRL